MPSTILHVVLAVVFLMILVGYTVHLNRTQRRQIGKLCSGREQQSPRDFYDQLNGAVPLPVIEDALRDLQLLCKGLPVVPRLEDRIFLDYEIDEEDTTDVLEAYANRYCTQPDASNPVVILSDFTVRDYIMQFNNLTRNRMAHE